MSDTDLVGIERLRAARELVSGRVHRTPLLASQTAAAVASSALGGARLADDRLYIKAEHLQKTGSFKPRGMTARVLGLSDAERARGIITLSAGNAGQAYAYVGGTTGVSTTVVMQADAVPSKVAACRGYGAEVVLHGAHFSEAFVEMERLRDEHGLTFCHPFDDPDVIAGHGSAGFEILEDLPDVDVVVVGIGGGGLISGVASAIRETQPSVRVYGVEPVESQAMTLALARGEIVRIQPASIADGLGAPFAGRWTMAMCARYLEGIVLIDDDTIAAGLRFALERMKQVLEPAGSAALAAVLTGRIPIRDGERVCVVASGGNVDVGRIGEFIARAAPLADAEGIAAAGTPRRG